MIAPEISVVAAHPPNPPRSITSSAADRRDVARSERAVVDEACGAHVEALWHGGPPVDPPPKILVALHDGVSILSFGPKPCC